MKEGFETRWVERIGIGLSRGILDGRYSVTKIAVLVKLMALAFVLKR